MTPENCKTCGAPLEQPARGRRKVYCSIACRRTQEAALDRIRSALADVEAKIQRHTAHPSAWGARTLPLLEPKRDRLARELAELQR
jgi:uncharacterized Zn finger protein (UPF0148 family)